MESNTISKSKSKINVKLIAITAMCAALEIGRAHV